MLSFSFSFEDIVQLLSKSDTFYLVKIDMQGNYAYLNEHFINRHATYYKHDGIKPATTALHPDDWVTCAEIFRNCVANPQQCFPGNARKLDGKGGYIVTSWEYKANCLPDGEVDGVVGIGYDITSFESHKEYIKFLTGKLNDAAHQQSHLVRRPLANIIGLVEVLNQMSEADESLKDVVTMLRQSCGELNEEFEAFLIRDFSDGNVKDKSAAVKL